MVLKTTVHKYQRNSVRVVRLEEIKPCWCRIVGRFESAKQSRKHQIRRRRIVTEWRREIRSQRANFSFNGGRQLLCRTAQRERRIFCVEIQCGRDRRRDPPRWRELFGWIDSSHPYKCAADTLVDIFFPDQFLFDLICAHERSEVVRCPDCVASGDRKSTRLNSSH